MDVFWIVIITVFGGLGVLMLVRRFTTPKLATIEVFRGAPSREIRQKYSPKKRQAKGEDQTAWHVMEALGRLDRRIEHGTSTDIMGATAELRKCIRAYEVYNSKSVMHLPDGFAGLDPKDQAKTLNEFRESFTKEAFE